MGGLGGEWRKFGWLGTGGTLPIICSQRAGRVLQAPGGDGKLRVGAFVRAGFRFLQAVLVPKRAIREIGLRGCGALVGANVLGKDGGRSEHREKKCQEKAHYPIRRQNK